jgi:hypothetical protein
MYNTQDGVIVAMNIRSALYEAKMNPRLKAPPLTFWSDVTFLMWSQLLSGKLPTMAGSNPASPDAPFKAKRANPGSGSGSGSGSGGNPPSGGDNDSGSSKIINPPKHILVDTIDNAKTKDIISYIKANYLKKALSLPVWPGVSYVPGDDPFYALLGSPNGYGAAWFLIQHKAQFGLYTISKITVYSQPELFSHMDMEITPVPVPVPESNQGQGQQVPSKMTVRVRL